MRKVIPIVVAVVWSGELARLIGASGLVTICAPFPVLDSAEEPTTFV